MASNNIWMPVYVGDLIRDTQDLDDDEFGAYVRILLHYWTQDGMIGSDIDRIRRVTKKTPEQVEKIKYIMSRYFVLSENGYHNNRSDEELEKAKKRSEAASGKAKRRWDMPQQCSGNATAMLGHVLGTCKSQSQSHSQSKSKREETPPPSAKTKSDTVHPKYNVPMNSKRYETLCGDYNKATVDEYVKRAVNYVAAKGKVPYKDYAAAAANFMSRDNVPKKIKSTGAAEEIELMKTEPVGTLTPEETQAMKLKAFSRSRDGPNIDF